MLVHRDFGSGYAARIIITKDNMQFCNPNRPKKYGEVNLKTYLPDSKNPHIASVFKEMGLVDELGSGFRKLAKYTKEYSQVEPIITESEIFSVSIPLLDLDKIKGEKKEKIIIDVTNNVTDNVTDKGNKNNIIDLIKTNPKISQQKIGDILGLNKRTITRHMNQLQQDKTICREGTAKKGRWIIL